MKALYNRKGLRGEGDRQSFAFFIVGAVVVLVAVFIVGIYFGRELEKGGAPSDNHAFRPAGEASRPEWAVQGGESGGAADNLRREIGSFSEEAIRVPVVPPLRAEAAPSPPDADNRLTFQESLSRKNAEPVPLEVPKAAGEKRGASRPEGGILIQAGAFKDREKAETRRKKMEKAGFSVRLSRSGKDGESGLFLVLAGPYPDRESARGAVSRLKSEQKIDAILQQKD